MMGAIHDRLYESYVTTHAGHSSALANRLAYRRDIRPHLPLTRPARVLDIGCGQGELVRLLREDGFDAHGVDISPEQVALARARGLDRIEQGDFFDRLGHEQQTWDAVVATDLLEHLVKEDVLRAFDRVRQGLRPGGVFVARVPNAVSPLGGHVMYGDVTHETWFTGRSVAQLAAVAGFATIRVLPCPPKAHGLTSGLRVAVWKPISGLMKLALAAETGRLHGHVVTQSLVFAARRAQQPGKACEKPRTASSTVGSIG